MSKPGYRYGKIKAADPLNPTDKEVRNYFATILEDYAGSNDGSELLANADFIVTATNN